VFLNQQTILYRSSDSTFFRFGSTSDRIKWGSSQDQIESKGVSTLQIKSPSNPCQMPLYMAFKEFTLICQFCIQYLYQSIPHMIVRILLMIMIKHHGIKNPIICLYHDLLNNGTFCQEKTPHSHDQASKVLRRPSKIHMSWSFSQYHI